MAFTFERFTHNGSTFTPKISVRSNGAIGVSQGALKRFDLMEGNFHFVLHYDKHERVIGMKPTRDAAEEGAVKLVRRTVAGKNGRTSINAYVSARSFLDYYSIADKKTKVYDAEWNDEHGMIIVDLKKPRDAKEEEDIP